MPQGSTFLGAQGTNWSDVTAGGAGIDKQLTNYTGTFLVSAAPTGINQKAYLNVNGYDGALQFELVESTGGTATLNIEGSFDSTNWYAIGYYTVVLAGATQATLTRTVAAFSITASSRNVLQLLDPYPLVRCRPSVNTGTITAGLYAIPQ